MINSKNIIEELIDFRNEDLWLRLKENFNISFEPSPTNEYSVYHDDQSVIFYIVGDNLCKDSFTHEMLHVYLRLNKCFLSSRLTSTIKQSRILSSFFSDDQLEQMGNMMEHLKMLPIYLEMGFDRELFILDYAENKCTDSEMNNIKINYKMGNKINSTAVNLLVGKLMAIKADPNTTIDYSMQLSRLKKVDPMLYTITDKMIEQWKLVKIENPTILDDTYYNVLSDYYNGLKKWMTNKTFV